MRVSPGILFRLWRLNSAVLQTILACLPKVDGKEKHFLGPDRAHGESGRKSRVAQKYSNSGLRVKSKDFHTPGGASVPAHHFQFRHGV
jgi:hypothetical protein